MANGGRIVVAITTAAAIVGMAVGAFQLRDYLRAPTTITPPEKSEDEISEEETSKLYSQLQAGCSAQSSASSLAADHPEGPFSLPDLRGFWCPDSYNTRRDDNRDDDNTTWRLAVVASAGKLCIYDRYRDTYSVVDQIASPGALYRTIATSNRNDLAAFHDVISMSSLKFIRRGPKGEEDRFNACTPGLVPSQ